MTAAKKTTTTRKTATRKATTRTRKPATEKRPRQRREVAPMTPPVRRAGAAAIAAFENMMMDQEGTGFISAATPVVKGPMANSKMIKRIKVELEDGSRHVAVVQVTFR
jgi:hypothetical protein